MFKSFVKGFVKITLAAQLLASVSFLPAYAKTDTTKQLLENLSNAHAASGSEGAVRKILYPIWKRDLVKFKLDGIGNISGVIPGGQAGPNVLLISHMDEVGFLVRNITDKGFIQVEPLGGWRDQVAYAQRWRILTDQGSIIGYSGEESGHIVPRGHQSNKSEQNNALHAAREMYIDIGASSKKEAIESFHIRPGLPITPDTSFTTLNNPNRYLGKAFDDRVGLAVVTDIIQRLKNQNHPNQITVAATVQEELGLRGAKVIANEYKPNVVINVEACIAGDHPFTATPGNVTYPSLGKGPCIYVYERSMIPNNRFVDWVAKVARENKIPFQYATAPNYGQDGSVLQTSGEGMPVILIGVPVRYAHQQSGVMDRSDLDATTKLIQVILSRLNNKELMQIKPQ